MKVVGDEGCEIGPWGYMPNDDPKVLKNAMDARGLTLVGATEGGNFLDDAAVEGMLRDIDDIFALLKAFPSAKYIVLLPPMYTNLAAGEPISFYKKWAKRIPYIHFKDCDLAVKAKMDENKWSFAKAVTEDIMVEPGKGSIDFAEMHKALDGEKVEGVVDSGSDVVTPDNAEKRLATLDKQLNG